MATESLVSPPGAASDNGPNGFIEYEQNMLVVDHGKIYLDGSQVGILYEDGLIQGMAPPFDSELKTIEEISCIFRGIDTQGVVVELPSTKRGPTGILKYNNIPYNVFYGRISSQDHRVIGVFEDDGRVFLRNHKNPSQLLEMDDKSQLRTSFQGIKSDGKPFIHDWTRGLHKADRSYADNEIMRYLPEDFDKLNQVQKSYVLETMKLWAASGVLQIVRKSEGDAGLGNVKHGASGVTGVRTGKVTLDREELETEITLYKKFGPIAKIQTRIRPYSEVRINLVVSHEFGHQLEFTLSQACQDKIDELYQTHLERCNRMHPLPEGYEGYSELLLTHQIEQRVFISGYSRASMHEYWAESVAAFSVKESRDMLKQMDPGVYEILEQVLFSPEKTLSPKHELDALKLQASLRAGGELSDDILNK
jgi:hypothetical protein